MKGKIFKLCSDQNEAPKAHPRPPVLGVKPRNIYSSKAIGEEEKGHP